MFVLLSVAVAAIPITIFTGIYIWLTAPAVTTMSVIISAIVSSVVSAALAGLWLSRCVTLRVAQVIRFAGKSAENDAVEWLPSRIREINQLGDSLKALAYQSKRRTEAQLEATAMFSSTFSHSPVAASLHRYPSLELMDVNHAWQRLFETSRDAALVGKDSQFQILAPGDAYAHMNTEVAANRTVLDYSITARTSSGKVLSLLVSCVRLVAAQTDYQLTTAIDITERVQTESALRDSEACLRAIVATLVEGVILVQNAGSRAVFCNPAALRMLGISLPELRGDVPRNPNWQIRDGDGTALTPAEWPSSMAVESGNPVLGRHLTVIRSDGSKCDITVNATPLEAASLGGHATLLTITDRSAEHKSLTDVQSQVATLEDKITHCSAELAEVNAELRAFSYSLSHDLRSPLRAIDGFAQLLNDRHGHELSPEAKRHLDRVLQSTKHMNGIIDDLLMLARVTQADTSYVTLSVSELATNVAEQLATDKTRQVEWQIESGIEINADPGLIRIVLENLLGNAWKYSARTAVAKISLRANTELPAGYVGFVVEDNGVGFDQKYVERLFTPFRRLHAETEFPGSGIGLATVKRAITRHGGSVGAEGVAGSGAKFWVTLPRHRRDE